MIETRVELNQCVLSKPVSELEKSMRPRSIMPPYIVTDLALVWLHPGGLHADASYATAFFTCSIHPTPCSIHASPCSIDATFMQRVLVRLLPYNIRGTILTYDPSTTCSTEK
jgi:hypothetical protein